MPVTFNTKAFRKSLSDLEAGLRNASAQAMRVSVQAAEASAKGTPFYQDRTGLLRQRTKGTADGLSGKLVADTKYAVFVENGRAITMGSGGKGKRAFTFVRNGSGKTSARTTSARPFMATAALVGQYTLESALAYLVDYAIAKSR